MVGFVETGDLIARHIVGRNHAVNKNRELLADHLVRIVYTIQYHLPNRKNIYFRRVPIPSTAVDTNNLSLSKFRSLSGCRRTRTQSKIDPARRPLVDRWTSIFLETQIPVPSKSKKPHLAVFKEAIHTRNRLHLHADARSSKLETPSDGSFKELTALRRSKNSPDSTDWSGSKWNR